MTCDCYGIIPARFASSRFPGKPLADILGRPMFWHVYQRSRQCRALREVVLATDDQRIYDRAVALNVPVLMTSTSHRSGTDRVLEAARQLGLSRESVVVNIQGDEPALEPAMLDQLLAPFEQDQELQVATLAREINGLEADDPNLVKVVLSAQGRALYFSRAVIPFAHSTEDRTYWGHIGLYAFRFRTLERFAALGPSPLEQVEQLEQLRLLEAGIPILVVPTRHQSIGVDRPEDLPRIVERLKEQN